MWTRHCSATCQNHWVWRCILRWRTLHLAFFVMLSKAQRHICHTVNFVCSTIVTAFTNIIIIIVVVFIGFNNRYLWKRTCKWKLSLQLRLTSFFFCGLCLYYFCFCLISRLFQFYIHFVLQELQLWLLLFLYAL